MRGGDCWQGSDRRRIAGLDRVLWMVYMGIGEALMKKGDTLPAWAGVLLFLVIAVLAAIAVYIGPIW